MQGCENITRGTLKLAANDSFILPSKQWYSSQIIFDPQAETEGLTYREDRPKHRGVLDSGAVPPVVPELELTLPDPVPGASAHVDHVVRVEHAELLLAGWQTLYPEREWHSQLYLYDPLVQIMQQIKMQNNLKDAEKVQWRYQFEWIIDRQEFIRCVSHLEQSGEVEPGLDTRYCSGLLTTL